MSTLAIVLIGVAFCATISFALYLMARKAPVMNDCRWCGEPCSPHHTLCDACRFKNDSDPKALKGGKG